MLFSGLPAPRRHPYRNPAWLPIAGATAAGLALGAGAAALITRARKKGAAPLDPLSPTGGRPSGPGAEMFSWTYPGPPNLPSLDGQILHSKHEAAGYQDRIWLLTAPFDSPLCGDAPCQYVAQFRSTQGHGFVPTATEGEAVEAVAEWRGEYAPRA